MVSFCSGVTLDVNYLEVFHILSLFGTALTTVCMSKCPWTRYWTPNCSDVLIGTSHGSRRYQCINVCMSQFGQKPWNVNVWRALILEEQEHSISVWKVFMCHSVETKWPFLWVDHAVVERVVYISHIHCTRLWFSVVSPLHCQTTLFNPFSELKNNDRPRWILYFWFIWERFHGRIMNLILVCVVVLAVPPCGSVQFSKTQTACGLSPQTIFVGYCELMLNLKWFKTEMQ